MFFMQFFLIFLSVAFSNTIWIRDDFLVCEKTSEVSNLIEFCEKLFFNQEKCIDLLANLKQENNKYTIINYEKK